MQQFFSSVSFCVRHIGYLFILCLPVMTIEFALTYLVTSIGIDANMSDSAALEVLSSISSQLFILVVLSLISSSGVSKHSHRCWLQYSQRNWNQALFSVNVIPIPQRKIAIFGFALEKFFR